jgi:hypothetical protein
MNRTLITSALGLAALAGATVMLSQGETVEPLPQSDLEQAIPHRLLREYPDWPIPGEYETVRKHGRVVRDYVAYVSNQRCRILVFEDGDEYAFDWVDLSSLDHYPYYVQWRIRDALANARENRITEETALRRVRKEFRP